MTAVYIVLLCLVGAAALLLAAAVIRTFLIKAPERKNASGQQFTQEVLDGYAEGLGCLIRIPSVSKRADEDLTEFKKLHAQLEKLFPLVHKTLEKTELDGTLLFCWRGSDSKRLPVLFMGHQDVVPASDDGWTVPAYSGTVRDGALFGRGALDCKCNVYIELEAIEQLIAQGFVPPCDVYVEASINEETGGDGAESAVRYLQRKGIRLALVIDEGGSVIEQAMPGMDRPYAVIGITEKGYIDLKVTARGKGGHSSTPPRNTPAARLFAFANEIEKKRPFAKKLLPEVEEMFAEMAPSFGFGMKLLLGNVWLFKPLIIAAMPALSPFGEALLATTCTFTMMKGSDAPNVIPKEPYLIANLRTSVQQNCEQSLSVMKKYADKYNLELEVLNQRDASPVASTKSAEYTYLKECISAQFPDVGIAPYVIMGGTDCRHFHAVTDNAFRFAPIRMTSQQLNSCHAIDENITVSAIAEGVEFFKFFLENYR
ncbi:MAG: M20/M25/M40 family metallo-hydrolase [Oscillospiraceae bacterium]